MQLPYDVAERGYIDLVHAEFDLLDQGGYGIHFPDQASLQVRMKSIELGFLRSRNQDEPEVMCIVHEQQLAYGKLSHVDAIFGQSRVELEFLHGVKGKGQGV